MSTNLRAFFSPRCLSLLLLTFGNLAYAFDNAPAVTPAGYEALTTAALAKRTTSLPPRHCDAPSTQAATTCTPHDDHWHCPEGVPEPTTPPAESAATSGSSAASSSASSSASSGQAQNGAAGRGSDVFAVLGGIALGLVSMFMVI
ncbi:hypothetical protein DM02DRAFT_656459 [Periconia macrospinosa]|uniref:Uncharacterized protein n=1 Tax=Periconia macrospinosa TaxID=97972 RepID=A0A2V1DMK0_9PLEO|nr:hypothetical protein DM02DRAFT_656459 [Periconia macrospinosa]